MTRDDPLLVLIGTKAQFIKTAPILNELDRRDLRYLLLYTGQHSETFTELEAAFGTRAADDVLVRDFEADSGRSFLAWSLRFWVAAGERISTGRWRGARMALVHGDTASTLFAALAASLAGIPVAHVEAGLRSPRLLEPFPEELIRRCVSKVSKWHFAPDLMAFNNLSAAKGQVINTHGNTLQDSLRLALEKNGGLAAQGGGSGYGVVSLHRNENLSNAKTFDRIMGDILAASSLLPLRFVLHPVTRKRIDSSRWKYLLEGNPRITLMARASYPDFVKLLLGAHLLMTDGGSNQEEAAMLGIPTLLLRRATERQDGLDDCVELSGLQARAIETFVHRHMHAYWTPRFIQTGSPSSVIVDALQRQGVWQGGILK